MDRLHTIFALSSGRPPAAIAVVRISGFATRFGLETLVGRIPEPRRAALARIKNPVGGDVLDEGLVLFFPGPNSETGEDLAELHLHGGRAIVEAVLVALGNLPGFRMAEGGEFTRRAFENGKLDLTAVEGLDDLIHAETEAQRKQAYGQLKGFLGQRAERWRARLIEASALVEARIDFSDETDVLENLVAPALDIARSLRKEIVAALEDGGRGERLRDGLMIAVAGPPNAGKSTLLNWLAKREVAIVTPIPGTTRDVIEVHLDLRGYPVTLLDTAGIRETDDPIEREGVRRARERSKAADLVLWVTDASGTNGVEPDYGSCDAVREVWRVRNKMDLVDSHPEQSALTTARSEFAISCLSGQGLGGLFNRLAVFAREQLRGEAALVTRERHRKALTRTAEFLRRAVESGSSEELIAEELRLASQELGRLTGRIDVENVLDKIFADFCIGK